METKNWCTYQLKSENSQKALEEKIERLLNGPLREKSDYAKEKAIDAFAQTFVYLESTLYYQKGIHPKQFNLVAVQLQPELYCKKVKEIEESIAAELDRSYRHFVIFL